MEKYIESLKNKCPIAINNSLNYFFEVVYNHYTNSPILQDFNFM